MSPKKPVLGGELNLINQLLRITCLAKEHQIITCRLDEPHQINKTPFLNTKLLRVD